MSTCAKQQKCYYTISGVVLLLAWGIEVCCPAPPLIFPTGWLQVQLNSIRESQTKLVEMHERSKTITRSADMKELREKMQVGPGAWCCPGGQRLAVQGELLLTSLANAVTVLHIFSLMGH